MNDMLNQPIFGGIADLGAEAFLQPQGKRSRVGEEVSMSSYDTTQEDPRDSTQSSSPSSTLTPGEDDGDNINIFQPECSTSLQEVEPNDIDALVARQMADLSLQERDKVFFDIHGVADKVQETPDFLDEKLGEFRLELDRLSLSADSEAYRLAEEQSPAYVGDAAFQLSFLRADLFDVNKAALRFVRHFQAKLDLFGEALLGKKITQDDLDEDALRVLYSGYTQYLPLRDRGGRLVHVAFRDPSDTKLESKLKRTFYMCMVSSEDEESQRNGRVAVSFLHLKADEGTPPNHWQVATLLSALPIRMEAFHLCHDRAYFWTPIFAVFKMVLGWFARLRIREHVGNCHEILFILQTFGIPVRDCFPLDEAAETILIDRHRDFWEKRRNLERTLAQKSLKPVGESVPSTSTSETASETPPSATVVSHDETPTKTVVQPAPPSQAGKPNEVRSEPPTTIVVPGQNDVLLGRGKGFYQHTGNIRFRALVEDRFPHYERARTSAEKKRLTCEVIGLIRTSGGRFLKDDSKCGWVIVTEEVARQKVAHVFRSLRESKGPNTNNNSNNSKGTTTTTSGASKRTKEVAKVK
eukprot:Nitzschia sp. Nitz4//scaffold37_size175936//85170//86912//NITZ4_002048-RA/size175936-processed-gene-0.223-mRNA-1//-1//CDS//3329549794//5213//frame0